MEFIQKIDDYLVRVLKAATHTFIHTRRGKAFLWLALVGPLTFIPTVWQAWTAENIDALRTFTWPMLAVVNCSVLVGLCYNGDWRLRFSLVAWIILTLLVWLAAIIR